MSAGDHSLSTGNLVAVRVDESMVVAHQGTKASSVVRVDAIDKRENGFFVRHHLESAGTEPVAAATGSAAQSQRCGALPRPLGRGLPRTSEPSLTVGLGAP